MKRSTQHILVGTAIVLALATTALATAYFTQPVTTTSKPVQQAHVYHEYKPTNYVAQQPAQPPCDDNNIIGTVGGAAAGGLIGSRFGGGNGKTAATTVGILGGAALGNKYIPTRGATCN